MRRPKEHPPWWARVRAWEEASGEAAGGWMDPSASPSVGSVSVVPFAPRHAAAFRELNVAWITEHFRIEPKDVETLEDPKGTILDKGGTI